MRIMFGITIIHDATMGIVLIINHIECVVMVIAGITGADIIGGKEIVLHHHRHDQQSLPRHVLSRGSLAMTWGSRMDVFRAEFSV